MQLIFELRISNARKLLNNQDYSLKESAMTLDLITHEINIPSYQITILFSLGTYILSPALVFKPSLNPSRLTIGLNALYCAGECGSVLTWLTTNSSVVFVRQIVAHDKKKR